MEYFYYTSIFAALYILTIAVDELFVMLSGKFARIRELNVFIARTANALAFSSALCLIAAFAEVMPGGGTCETNCEAELLLVIGAIISTCMLFFVMRFGVVQVPRRRRVVR